MTYSHIISQWKTFFGSLTKALEVLAVWEGIKPCARILVYEADYARTIHFLETLPLAVRVADFKVSLNVGTSGYSSKGTTIPLVQGSPPGHLVLYVSRKSETATLAQDAEARLDHRELGRVLGYPSCCTRFFMEYAQREQARHNTFIAPLLEHSRSLPAHEAYPWENNIFLRPIDICLIAHIPCSLECNHSRTQARAMLSLLHKYSTKAEQLFRERLASTLLVHETGNIVVLEGAAPSSNPGTQGISFMRAFSERPWPILEDLNRARHVEELPHGGLLVGQKIIPEWSLVRFS